MAESQEVTIDRDVLQTLVRAVDELTRYTQSTRSVDRQSIRLAVYDAQRALESRPAQAEAPGQGQLFDADAYSQ